MSSHNCPYCECDGRVWSCGYCGRRYNENEDTGNGDYCCSPECSEALHQRTRQEDWDRAIATRAQRVERGQAVCRAHVRNGRPCASSPIRGADLCNGHADDQIRFARDYGRVLGEMAIDGEMARAFTAGRPWSAVINANRKAVVLAEMQRQLVEAN